MFTDEQQNQIYEIMINYNSDDEYHKSIEEKYDTNPVDLSIMEIYALEDIFRYGHNGYFKALISKRQHENQDILKEYEMFIDLFKNNPEFKENEIDKYLNSPESLSAVEEFLLSLIIKNEKVKDQENVEDVIYSDDESVCEFDDFVELKYGNEQEIRESILNIKIGNLIYEVFNNEDMLKFYPELKGVISRQAEPGMIDNADKPLVAKIIKTGLEQDRSGIIKNIEDLLVIIKFDIQLGKGASAFDKHIKQRTNVRNEEVGFKLDSYNQFEDLFGKFRK